MITMTDPILWINAPSIGFKMPKTARIIAIIFNINANAILILIVLMVFRAIPIK